MNKRSIFKKITLQAIPKKLRLLWLSCIVLWLGCQSPTSQKEINLSTPEEVAKKWQELVYKNQFEAAKNLSTPNAKEWINWIANMVAEDSSSETSANDLEMPVYLEMKCKELGKKATCSYLMKEEGQLFRDSFLLLKVNGQWLVDIPEEDLELDDSLEQMLQEMEEILKE